MLSRRSAAALVAAVLALAACGSSSDSGSDGDTGSGAATVEGADVAVGAAPAPLPATAPAAGDGAGSIGDAVEVAAGAPGEASDAACTMDRQTLESAVETYELLNGALPTTQQELLDAQMIRELSVRFDVTADGLVTPAAGSPCT
jgi:hypothetical protein